MKKLFKIVPLLILPMMLTSCMDMFFRSSESSEIMCIFKGVGKGRMNWVADEYNRNGGANVFSYQISPYTYYLKYFSCASSSCLSVTCV